MFWICIEEGVDVLAVAEQHLDRAKAISGPHHTNAGWGWKGAGRGHSEWRGQLAPTVQRDIPHHMASCSAYKAEERGKEKDVQSDDICLPKTPIHVVEPGFPGDC